jgi:tetratricopeptide (TPR) repeat protein
MPDPLLPERPDDRPLTPGEKAALTTALDQLNMQAAANYAKGDRIAAYQLWNRELRLRRALGSIPEIQALGRVGAIAWEENNQIQLRWITQRLDAIFAQVEKPNATKAVSSPPAQGDRLPVFAALGTAYQQVRLPKTAVLAYEQILADARQRQDNAQVKTTLDTLGQLHLSWFDYTKAAITYQELVAIAQQAKNDADELTYLTQLAYLHEQAKQPDRAVAYQEQLVSIYRRLQNSEPVPALLIRMGNNYRSLKRVGLADQRYRTAHQLALALLQLGRASDALYGLATLYREYDRWQAALQVYNSLLGLQRQSYNAYGVMETYNQIGQTHLSQKNYPEAIGAFQQGLAIAQRVGYRESYFTQQIQQTSQQQSGDTPSSP